MARYLFSPLYLWERVRVRGDKAFAAEPLLQIIRCCNVRIRGNLTETLGSRIDMLHGAVRGAHRTLRDTDSIYVICGELPELNLE